MIVNLTKNRLLQQVQKIELLNWDWFGILYAIQRKLLPKMHSYHFIKKPYFLFPNSEKMVFLKKVALEYDPSCIISKDDISFSRNNDLII